MSADRAQKNGTAEQPWLDSPDLGDRHDEFWTGRAAELTGEQIGHSERVRAEAEAIEDESRPCGLPWKAGQ